MSPPWSSSECESESNKCTKGKFQVSGMYLDILHVLRVDSVSLSVGGRLREERRDEELSESEEKKGRVRFEG